MASNSFYQYTAGSQKGDIYSFAIIVQEIFYRKGVFYLTLEDREANFGSDLDINCRSVNSNLKITYKDIYNKVKVGLRPSLESEFCPREIIDLLKRCWSENIHERPDFSIIRDMMRKIIKLFIFILELGFFIKYLNIFLY